MSSFTTKTPLRGSKKLLRPLSYRYINYTEMFPPNIKQLISDTFNDVIDPSSSSDVIVPSSSSDVIVPSVIPPIKRDPISEIVQNEQRDVRIEVGEGENARTFMVHSMVLMHKAEYFEKAFSNPWVRIEDGVKVFKKGFIPPAAFEVIIE